MSRTLLSIPTLLRVAMVSLLLAGLGCSDDDKPPAADLTVADKALIDLTGVDKTPSKDRSLEASTKDRGPDSSGATGLKGDTIAFVKALAAKLSSSATPAKAETYVLSDSEAAGFIEDVTKGKGIEAGYTDKDITDLINGTHDPFAKEGCSGFAKQDYIKGKDTLLLYLWQMNTAAGAKKMFDENKKKVETTYGVTFETIASVQDMGIIGEDSPDWRVFGYKGRHIYKIIATTGL